MPWVHDFPHYNEELWILGAEMCHLPSSAYSPSVSVTGTESEVQRPQQTSHWPMVRDQRAKFTSARHFWLTLGKSLDFCGLSLRAESRLQAGGPGSQGHTTPGSPPAWVPSPHWVQRLQEAGGGEGGPLKKGQQGTGHSRSDWTGPYSQVRGSRKEIPDQKAEQGSQCWKTWVQLAV